MKKIVFLKLPKTGNSLSLYMYVFAITVTLIAVENKAFGQTQKANFPTFSKFSYTGNDDVYNQNPLMVDEFYTPILQGYYPDPSITRKGNDYYLVTSSFSMFPGVPIFHSNDLVNWKQIGNVLDRKSQLKVEGSGISEGVFAPSIRYNPNNDTFYMITTQVTGGLGNMLVKTKDPLKGWSEPYKLKFDGIDPSLFFDDDGRAFIVHNDAPDKEKELYSGHRVIKIWEYDVSKDQVILGTDNIIVNGGVDLSKKPIWIEAPHIYKKNGLYYLMCAEGGTGDNHSEVIFVSQDVNGPYIPAEKNPILSQRHLPNDRENKVDWAGHADLVEGPDRTYYGVFLGIRPNEKNRVNIGRETFILPVDWDGEFPVFRNGLEPITSKLKMPVGVVNKVGQHGFFPNGNFNFVDNFNSSKMDYRWIALKGPKEDFIHKSDEGLQIRPFKANIKNIEPTSAIFIRQQHKKFSAEVTLDFRPQFATDLAGVTCLQSEQFNYVFGITKKEQQSYLVLVRTNRLKSEILASQKIKNMPIRLKITSNGDSYEFSYAQSDNNFKNLGGAVSGDVLSTNVAGGFNGTLIGLYATSGNEVLLNK